MTRKEYIAALDQYLVTLSASEKADILSDYEEHFRVGLENGKTESQIAASLGSPYDVANQFLDGEKPQVPQYPRQRAQTAASQTAASAGYTAQQRPTQTTASEGYTAQQRPTRTTAPTGYTTQQRPAQTAAPQGNANYTPAQPQRIIYDNGIQDYAQAQGNRQSYSQQSQGYASQPNYQQPSAQNSGYVDYDREAAARQSYSQPSQSQYNTTGIVLLIVLCVVLIPTVGSTIVGLLVGLYGAVIGFAAAGGSLIVAGAALSASNLWVCVGLVFLGISFLLLTGLLIMGSIEGTKLFVKLIKYCIKEGKKLVTEGSF